MTLDHLAREIASEWNAASAIAVAGAVRRPSRWSKALGVAGRLAEADHAASVEVDTWFDLASLTKPITALAAARLARAGKLALGTPLGALLPELAATSSGAMSIELLLAHRAGLESHRSLYRDLVRGKFTGRAAALVEAASARRPDARLVVPEGGFEPLYSDLGYLLVGEALARAADRELDAVLTEHVLAPLQAAIGSARELRARDARFERRVAATEIVPWRGGALVGYVHDENAWFWSAEGSSGHAGLFGNVEGVLDLGMAVVDAVHGRLAWFLTKEEMWPLVKPRPGGTLRAGFDGKSAVGSSSGTAFGANTIGHLGFTGTSLWCDVDREMVGVLLTNRVHPTRDNDTIRKVRPFVYDRIGQWAAGR